MDRTVNDTDRGHKIDTAQKRKMKRDVEGETYQWIVW